MRCWSSRVPSPLWGAVRGSGSQAQPEDSSLSGALATSLPSFLHVGGGNKTANMRE
jgi:hypothetical protein